MSRNVCLALCAVQVTMIAILIGLPRLVSAGLANRETIEPLFTLVGVMFVVISPVGLLSLYMSLGFLLVIRLPWYGPELRRLFASRSPVKFLVWKEFREEYFTE